MISSAFKSAVQSEVSAQGQEMSNISKPAKEFGSFALSMFGMKNLAMAAGSIGEAATASLSQEKMLSAVRSQEALDNAYMRAREGVEAEDLKAELSTVYQKLASANREREAQERILDELKRGDEE